MSPRTSRAQPLRTRPLRVLIGADTYAPHVNGASSFTQRLVSGLSARGHEVHVVAPSTDRRSRTLTSAGAVEHRVRSFAVPGPPNFRAVPVGAGAHLRRVVDEVAPDVVHVQCHYAVGRGVLSAARATGVPSVATNHVMPDNLTHHLHLPSPLERLVDRLSWKDLVRVLDRADLVTTPTSVAADLLRTHGVRSEVEAISCGTDLHRFRPTVDPAAFRARHGLPEAPTVGFVGRLDTEKHVDELVRAFSLVRDRVDAHLLVVGIGNERTALEALVADLDLGGHVTFAGFVTDGDLPGAYAAADVWVNPGTAELQSIVTLEAMATGKPVVGADARALPLLVREGLNGHLFTPGDVAGLAGAITHVLTDDVAAAMMGRASLRLVGAHDTEATLDAFEDVYARVLGRARALSAPTLLAA